METVYGDQHGHETMVTFGERWWGGGDSSANDNQIRLVGERAALPDEPIRGDG